MDEALGRDRQLIIRAMRILNQQNLLQDIQISIPAAVMNRGMHAAAVRRADAGSSLCRLIHCICICS